ncbi:MAG: regulatory protein RecX [Candidatus Omnitrophica bacterium]|nr:regulatory protein RecX [Candidatus Omnitrophota bacterium]
MQKAKADALRLLRFRPRSVKEMAQRLKQKGHRGFMIARVINELIEKKSLDDRVFSRLWIGDRMHIKPAGRNLITRELKAKGVDDETIAAAFGELEGSFDEYEIAMPLVRGKMAHMKGIEKEKAKKKLLDFLGRRGFSYNTIWKIIKENYDYGPTEE